MLVLLFLLFASLLDLATCDCLHEVTCSLLVTSVQPSKSHSALQASRPTSSSYSAHRHPVLHTNSLPRPNKPHSLVRIALLPSVQRTQLTVLLLQKGTRTMRMEIDDVPLTSTSFAQALPYDILLEIFEWVAYVACERVWDELIEVSLPLPHPPRRRLAGTNLESRALTVAPHKLVRYRPRPPARLQELARRRPGHPLPLRRLLLNLAMRAVHPFSDRPPRARHTHTRRKRRTIHAPERDHFDAWKCCRPCVGRGERTHAPRC